MTDYKELVERLRGNYRVPITDGLGPVGGDEPDNPHEFVRRFETPPISKEAADAIEQLTLERTKARFLYFGMNEIVLANAPPQSHPDDNDSIPSCIARFNRALTAAQAERAERDTARASLTAMTVERDGYKTALTEAVRELNAVRNALAQANEYRLKISERAAKIEAAQDEMQKLLQVDVAAAVAALLSRAEAAERERDEAIRLRLEIVAQQTADARLAQLEHEGRSDG